MWHKAKSRTAGIIFRYCFAFWSKHTLPQADLLSFATYFGGRVVESFCDDVTHVIVGTQSSKDYVLTARCESLHEIDWSNFIFRPLKYFYGILRSKWIVSFDCKCTSPFEWFLWGVIFDRDCCVPCWQKHPWRSILRSNWWSGFLSFLNMKIITSDIISIRLLWEDRWIRERLVETIAYVVFSDYLSSLKIPLYQPLLFSGISFSFHNDFKSKKAQKIQEGIEVIIACGGGKLVSRESESLTHHVLITYDGIGNFWLFFLGDLLECRWRASPERN